MEMSSLRFEQQINQCPSFYEIPTRSGDKSRQQPTIIAVRSRQKPTTLAASYRNVRNQTSGRLGAQREEDTRQHLLNKIKVRQYKTRQAQAAAAGDVNVAVSEGCSLLPATDVMPGCLHCCRTSRRRPSISSCFYCRICGYCQPLAHGSSDQSSIRVEEIWPSSCLICSQARWRQ
ncbi:hypothetical protein RRG08_036042 [Elysia crispata]|uniref:Uncharacterized protein n=1 Tax=Elysia crispata TaxID=231223 RepID=A0AAE1E0H0_9GAST|nr:hypothetical protein RRG08_036042 [Elysia crispata]